MTTAPPAVTAATEHAAALDAVAALHRPDLIGRCVECDKFWPCPTTRILNGYAR